MEAGSVKYKLQQDTVKAIVEQLEKGSKVEFDSGLMTVEDFMHCFNAAKSIVDSQKPLKNKGEVKGGKFATNSEGAD
jgi:hypothetical protein